MGLPAPMLATAGPMPPGPGWAYEFKWDGIRVLCDVTADGLRIHTRHGNDVTRRFPELAGIREAVGDALFDGELTVFAGSRPDFGAAVRRVHAGPATVGALAEDRPATVLVFDLLRLDGTDLRQRSYEQRRDVLEGMGPATERWLVPPAFHDGPATVAASLAHGLEGVVAKRLTSPYVSGRSRNWIKTRHDPVSDLAVAGWVRTPSGKVSLLLAERAPEGLAYRGRCTAPAGLLPALERLATGAPAVDVPEPPAGVRWVRPELDVEVAFASRTPDGRARHARFVRARLDQLA